ncbi:MAG: hypothetical protein V4537_15870 [Pseudomonadota bacterium]
MARGVHPDSREALKRGARVSADRRVEKAAEGRAWAREWRRRNGPIFDEMYK